VFLTQYFDDKKDVIDMSALPSHFFNKTARKEKDEAGVWTPWVKRRGTECCELHILLMSLIA
jgi:hypothetical protein